MSFFQNIDLDNPSNFSVAKSHLTVAEREKPKESDIFFKNLIRKPFSASGKVFKQSSVNDIRAILEKNICTNSLDNDFYNYWLNDMAKMCNIFCTILESNSISFFLGTSRGCSRYHIDNVPMRLLITYFGQGTEWLPSDNADYSAYYRGEGNNKILKNAEKRMYIKSWDVSIFKGGKKGILHRTPDSALKSLSLLMRLDHSSFLDDIEKYNTLHL